MSNQAKYYWPIESQTKQVLDPVDAQFKGGIWHIPKNALTIKPLPPKDGYAVIAILDEKGLAVGSQYRVDHRGKSIYNEANCRESKRVQTLDEIEEGWGFTQPSTPFDEWVNGTWVTNVNHQYQAAYNQVDTLRRGLYVCVVDPLISEATIKRLLGDEETSLALETQAIAARTKIQAENPWPTPPEAQRGEV
ncbi:hypothetical protein L4D77_15170 [Photobacterium frigidiphilum]|uniref:hypothetical protein n=1 Tax=Photobacterium frigidiphilum TaxID=264736 RepID=UPI003D1499FD